jgi:1,4-alpha-glucan branching enzyme
LTSYNALFYYNYQPEGFEWMVVDDRENSVLAYLRKGKNKSDRLLVILNMTPVIREDYQIGVHENNSWSELLNSDDKDYGGSGIKNAATIKAQKVSKHDRPYSIRITCPPLAILILAPNKPKGIQKNNDKS